MVDFDENPWMGELLNVLYEQGAIISLICRAPVAPASAKHRVTAFARPGERGRVGPAPSSTAASERPGCGGERRAMPGRAC